MDFAEKTLRPLHYDHFDGVGDVFGRKDSSGVFRTARRELGGYAAGADHAHANAVLAQVFRHAGGKTLEAPLGGAVDTAAGEGVAATERTDAAGVACASWYHRRSDN